MSSVYATSYGERIGSGRAKGELHTVVICTTLEEARSEAKGWRRAGYQARTYPRRPMADGVVVPVVFVIVRRRPAGGAE